MCWFLLSFVLSMGDVSAWVGWMIWEKGSSVQTLSLVWAQLSCSSPDRGTLGLVLGHQFGETSFKQLSSYPSEVLTLYPRARAISSLLPVSMYIGMKRAVGNARYSC